MYNFQEYINKFPKETQEILIKLRTLIVSLAPEVEESMSYGMPAFKTFGKPLLYFAAYEKHIGLYATPSAQIEFKEILISFKQGKGSVQFPLNNPIPFGLIEKIIKFRIKENIIKYKK